MLAALHYMVAHKWTEQLLLQLLCTLETAYTELCFWLLLPSVLDAEYYQYNSFIYQIYENNYTM